MRHRVQHGPFPIRNEGWVTVTASPSRPFRGTARAERLRRARRLGYPSRVCSIMGDEIERIAEAIDQLASDAQGEVSGQALAARVAELWLMVSAIDPELARRQQRYATPADGPPSQ